MHRTLIIGCLSCALLVACANPLNRVTMESYMEGCASAEQARRLDVAAEACRRAWINTRIGNLGPEAESTTLYNWGRVLRKDEKLVDAEQALKRSLELEEKLSGPTSAKTGRRLAELSMTLIMQRRAADGIPYLERLMVIAPEYVGEERRLVAAIFYGYADELRRLGSAEAAEKFETVAKSLGLTRAEFEKAFQPAIRHAPAT